MSMTFFCLLPENIKNYLRKIRDKAIIKRAKNNIPQIKRRISRNNHINVFFILSSFSMWRYDNLCKLLITDSRFSLKVLIIPFLAYSETEREKEINTSITHLSKIDIPFITIKNTSEFLAVKRSFKPDVIFYQQPYDGMFEKGINWRENIDCILAYSPYFLGITSAEWLYNLPFHNALWRHYQPTQAHFEVGKNFSKNMVIAGKIIGDLRYDDFHSPIIQNPWKRINDGKERKRIIWAPHFRITDNEFFNRPDFFWTAKKMKELSEKYSHRIQIAFKPHPGLKSALYNHPDWGEKRTNEFYDFWGKNANTQLEEGDYIDLFKTSDALIHNSGSFMAEYLYVNKPMAYTTIDVESVRKPLHEFGRECLDVHYILNNEEDIENFINKVIIDDVDNLKDKRITAYNQLINNLRQRSVAESLYDDLQSLIK